MSRGLFLGGIKLAAAGMIFLLICGWLQNVSPIFDSATHFRLHLVIALALTGLLLLAFRCWAWVMASLLAIIISIGLTLPYLPGLGGISARASTAETASSPSGSTEIRVVQANILYKNSQTHRIAKVIAAAQPDIILLQEITRISQGILADFKASHPHQVHCHHRGIGSVAILSRFPFGNPQRQQCQWRLGFAQAEIDVAGTRLDVASFHSRWPWPFSQPRQLKALQDEFQQLRHPVILAGDFNSAPWSASVAKVADWTGTQIAPGLYLTWSPPLSVFRQIFGAVLPIDQIMISPQLTYLSREVLADGGSDHYPVLTKIKLR